MIAGDSSVLSSFHDMHGRDITDVLESISETYPVEKIVAVPVGAHFTQPNGIGAFRANSSSILNYSQARIVGLRNTYALPRAATDAVIEIVTDPKFDAREIGTKYVRKLEATLLKAFLSTTCELQWMASKTCACFFVQSNMLLPAFSETRPSLNPWSLPFIPPLTRMVSVRLVHLWEALGAKCMRTALDLALSCSRLQFLSIRAILGSTSLSNLLFVSDVLFLFFTCYKINIIFLQ
jgi:hypothetical protein